MLRWLLWFGFVALWTAMLVTPASLHDELPLGEFVLTRRALFAKTAHVAGYAFFAILTGWLRVPKARRPVLLIFLVLHAVGTEFIQDFVPGRVGSFGDMLFNSLGIALGLAASWKWWARD